MAVVFFILLSSAVLAPSGTGARFNTKTVSFYLNSTNGQIAAAAWNNFTTSLSLPDTSITILSAYLKVSATFGIANAAKTIDVYLNDTLLGKYSYTNTQEITGIEINANASRGASGSDLYTLSSTPQYNKISILCNDICSELNTVAFITYKYDPPAENGLGASESKNDVPVLKKEKSFFQKIREKILTLLGIEKIFL